MSLLLTVVVISLMGVMSPGPDFVVCLKNTLKYSRAAGIWTALGFACGTLVHVTYCILGLALIISQSILLFNIIKWIGAAYLIYIGVKALFSKSSEKMNLDIKKSNQTLSSLEAWESGFFTNVLNPKATIFFLGVFSVVIPPETSTALLLAVGGLIFLMTFSWFSFVATVMTLPPVRKQFLKIEKAVDKVFGGVLILLGIKVATAKL